MRDLRLVLERLLRAKLTEKLIKCFFACQEVDCLGHTIGIGKMTPRQATLQSMLEAHRLLNRKQLKSFLGGTGFYQYYIPRYSDLTAPLTDLMRKGKSFVWDEEAEGSFLAIKKALCDGCGHIIADFSKPFVLFADASLVACGTALCQSDEHGLLHPVCYFIKKFNDCQRSYTVCDREALALVLATQAFKIYLSSGPTIIFTEHEPLQFINSMALFNRRLLRWAMELQQLQLEILHVKGKHNILADYLSRPAMLTDWANA